MRFQEMPVVTRQRVLVCAGMALILFLYVIAVIRLHPANFFGLTGDDAIYFSSAQAIAAGKGYVLPCLPGTPPATKYPVLYPWVLSWVWRWNPSFPANLPVALGFTVTFGLGFLVLTFLFLRRLKGIGEKEALLLTAFCALQPAFLFYSGNLLTDVPFAALALAAMVIADRAMQPTAGKKWSLACGIVVGISMLLRVFGVPLAAGLVLSGILRRAWRQSFVFGASVSPFFVALAWQAIFPVSPLSPVVGAAASSFGWVRIWTYYTSYIGAWKLAVPSAGVFLAMLKNNAGAVIKGPGEYFLDPLFAHRFWWGPFLAVLVAAAVVASTIRQFRNQQWKSIQIVLPFYASLILVWNFADSVRFLLPFLPLFAAGLWLEGKHFLSYVRENVSQGHPWKDRMAAAALGVVVFMSAFAIACCYKDGMRKAIAFESEYRGRLLNSKLQAYSWLHRNSTSKASVIAWEDGSTYLYTGRLALRPFMFTTEELYEPQRVTDDLNHATDVAHAIGAEYWIFAEDDFAFLWGDRPVSVDRRMREIEQVLPLVYRSGDGRVRMYSLSCIQHPEYSSCRSAAKVLFPRQTDTFSPVAESVRELPKVKLETGSSRGDRISSPGGV
jgi:hypothetical protein